MFNYNKKRERFTRHLEKLILVLCVLGFTVN